MQLLDRAYLAVSKFWNVIEKPVLGSGGMPIQISSPHPSLWLPPISSYVKINIDGSWKSGSAMAGVGVIIRKIAVVLVLGVLLLSHFTNLNWAWVPREVNRSADALPHLLGRGCAWSRGLCDLHPL
ncbi:hypothetical protein Pyn_07128 [Prunus yedoensis var. nudiflora]|uniref:RNase H type-1 domain-containing protein n=1 Tax=Prunus yedoensis var. nudiflora TaxID=2094558 RepID=A0A314Z6A5_PRUYE|nr:hypothetical protein Pyn_07128 [Prunus yedoensis var. nudiflora]